jgi:diadenosine tetraphosphate (Ap4A) HIT family hydrolase
MTDCIFCKIVAGTIPSKMIYEDEDVIFSLCRNSTWKALHIAMRRSRPYWEK